MACNKCGKNMESITNIIIKPSFPSIFDGDEWILGLCDNCLNKLAKSLIHPPTGFMEDPYQAYGEALTKELQKLDKQYIK